MASIVSQLDATQSPPRSWCRGHSAQKLFGTPPPPTTPTPVSTPTPSTSEDRRHNAHQAVLSARDLLAQASALIQPRVGSADQHPVNPGAGPWVSLKVLDDEIDVLTLKASLTADDTGRIKLNVTTFFSSAWPGCRHEVTTLVKRSLPADVVDLGLDFSHNSVLSVRIHLDSGPVTVHNVHRKRKEPFSVCDVFNRPGWSILLGDPNAHNNLWGPPTRASTTEGRTLADQRDEVPNYVIINESVATHIEGGGLDLVIVLAWLAPRATWSLHHSLVSDHFRNPSQPY